MARIKKKISLEYVILGVILVFALFLRVYALGNAPLWVDEAISANTASKILEKGVPEFDSGFLSTRALVFHYIQAFFLLFGHTDFNVRIISVIFGLLTIFLGYKIGKEYSPSGGLIVAGFLAVFYLEVFFSRQARFYQLFQFMFFLSVYLLYKSKFKTSYLYLSLLALIICYDSQIAGLVLAPFFILHILVYNRKKGYLSIVPFALLLFQFSTLFGLGSGSASSTVNYASSYFDYASNMIYLLILFVPGSIWAFFKKKELTLLLLLPSVALLLGVFSLKTFALRYSYFFVFALVVYSGLLMAFLYDRYGKMILIPIFLLLLVPSNLVYPYTYVNVIKPIDYNFNDYTAPYTDYKNLPVEIKESMQESTLISLFSLDAEWYIRKPDYVLPFSLDGRGNDQVSYLGPKGVVDLYSGAPILNYTNFPERPYYVLVDEFSVIKLRSYQLEGFKQLIDACEIGYQAQGLKIYNCLA